MTVPYSLRGIFEFITRHPRWVVGIGTLVIGLAVAGLPRLEKDTSIDAFVPPGHSSLLANATVDERFGLTEPIAVGVFVDGQGSVFSRRAMQLISTIADELSRLENLHEDRVASITSESSIRSDGDAIRVEGYYSAEWSSPEFFEDSRRRWESMAPHVNTLVSEDGKAAVIMSEVLDSRRAAATYQAVNRIVDSLDPKAAQGFEILVAGPAAVSGYLSDYINQDARLLQPLVFTVVMLFLYLAFLRVAALLGPVFVLLGAVGGAMGVMAWNGVPYFAITNALPVILVAIAVADAIHILSAYFRERAAHPGAPARDAIVAAMLAMARPITLTSVTTVAGFAGIAATSIMPPISYFAVYAMLGVTLAWAFSLFVLPAVLALVEPRPSTSFRTWRDSSPDRLSLLLSRISLRSALHPGVVITVFLSLIAVSLAGASKLRIDRSQVENFRADEPLRIADERIHERFAGTAFLDVVVSTDDIDGLLDAGRIQKIADLQAFLESLPHVSKTVSIADYLSLLHDAVEGTQSGERRTLPEVSAAVAQYLMVYEASGDPSDLDEEITPDYDSALVRIVLDTHMYSESRVVVSELQRYLEESFNEPGMHGLIAGDVNVAYHWMTGLKVSHFLGVAVSLFLIFTVTAVLFRSLQLGLIAVIPVSFTVLVMYGLMGATRVYLEPATSMFAAISLGVGVDFAIHLIDGLRHAQRHAVRGIKEVIDVAVPLTARACLFNAAALGLGFATLLLSDLPTLQRFGALVAVASFTSFLVALIVVPACFALLTKPHSGVARSAALAVAVCLASVLLLMPEGSFALDGNDVARKVAERREAPALIRLVRMTIEDRRGRSRTREAVIFRRYLEAHRETRITYLTPKPVRELSFLSRDFREPGSTDLRWLYLPAARKVRRIPASDRGDYFLGTDFTYEDVQSDLKFNLSDYRFELDDAAVTGESSSYRLLGTAISDNVASELGYGRFEAIVDRASWFPSKVTFFDPKQRLLKTIVIHDLHEIDGVWSAGAIEAEHHLKQHRTRFDYLQIQHVQSLPDSWFDAGILDRGLPEFENLLQ